MKKQREKDKYIIYNEDNKVLIFTLISSRETMRILIPSISKYDVDGKQDFYYAIKNLLVKDSLYLGQNIYSQMVYESRNKKLQKETLQIIRNYYSCYKEMKENDYIMLMKICYENGVLPHFVTIEELKQLIIKSVVSCDFDVDTAMYSSLEELQKRLNFEKY